MGFKPTPEQEYVLNIKDKSTIVSASAGSGKTTVMVEKIFNILQNEKIPVSDILVVTFTKSAALEMKQRLAKKLNENSENLFIQKQIDELSTADICTVDSFCEKIVKKYFYTIGIDESFSVVSTQEKNDLMSRAMQSAMATFKNNDTEKYKLLIQTFSNNRTEKQIISLILKTYDFMSSLKDANEFLEKTKALYIPNGTAEKYLCNYINETLEEYKKAFTKLQYECQNFGFSKYIQAINVYLSYLDAIILSTSVKEKLNAIDSNPSVIIRIEKSDENNFKEKITNLKTNCQKFITNIKEKLGDSHIIENSFYSCKKICSAFIDLLLSFKQKYTSLKLKYNMLDFADLEKYTLQILQNNEILTEIKNNYQKIFVDEFQDVNEIQFTIFDTITSLDNAFYVGDFKQAIYGFRQSNPRLFLETVNRFNNNTNACSITLKSNFRSDCLVLEFINVIFNSIMTIKTSEINYHDANLDGDKNYKKSDIPAVEIDIVQEDKKTDEIKTGIYSVKNDYLNTQAKDNLKQKEALRIAEIITEIIGKRIYDNKSKEYKTIDYSDIAILLRKRGDFQSILANTLASCDIPYVANLKELLDETYDVKILYSALKSTITPNDDYITCGLMLSPLFNFSENELVTIKLNAEGKSFCESILKYANSNENKLSKKIENFYTLITELKDDIRYKGIYEALWNLCDKTNYFFNISEDVNFITRQQNVINYINSFAGTNFEFDIIKYINMRENSLSDTNTTNISSQTSRVTITTMHQSKGLEYPIVILANLGEDFSREPDNNEIKLNNDFGIGIKTYDKETNIKYSGLFYTAVDLKNKSENLGERLRLLYVATTRAKNALYMIGSVKELNFVKNTDFNVLSANRYLNLIIGSLPQEDIDKVNLGQSFNIFGNEKYEFKYISSFSNNKISSAKFLTNEILSDEEIQLKDSATKYLNTSLDNIKHKIALKNSVSKLSFDEENSSINFVPKKLSLTEDLTEVNTTEQGTFVHKVLEEIDFIKIITIDDLENEIKLKFSNIDFDLSSINIEKLFNIVLKIKSYINKDDKILKEQKFVSYIPANQVIDEQFDDKILIQGAIDLMIVKPNIIYLFDYKLSSLNKTELIKKYNKQLSLYALAIKKAFNKPVIKYLVNLKSGEIYKL